MIDWANEQFVKLHTRDTAAWLKLTWKQQGLYCLLLRKVDRSGCLDLSDQGDAGVALHFGGEAVWQEIEPELNKLIETRWVKIEGDTLILPRFVESQTTRQSDRVRQAESRRRRQQPSPPVTGGHQPSPLPTGGDEPSPAVTDGHLPSPAVTTGHQTSPVVTSSHTASPRPEGGDRPSPDVTDGHPPSPDVTSGHPPSPDVTSGHQLSRLDKIRSDEITTPPIPPAADAAAGSPQPQAVLPLHLTAPPRARRDFDAEVFDYWRFLFAPNASEVLDTLRRKIIAKRRAERSKDTAGHLRDPDLVQRELLGSLDGWKNDPWKDRHLHVRLEQLLGNAGDVDQGLRFLAAGPPKPDLGPPRNRQPGGYVSEAEILAQDFTLRPGDVPEFEEAQ